MNKTILAIGAHPDDIEFGAGALLLIEKHAGSTIHLVITSRGEAGTNGTAESRSAEATLAAEKLGATIQFLDFGGDSHLWANPGHSYELAKIIRELKPDIILAPQPVLNQHPDHAAVGIMTRNACRYARYGGLVELKNQPSFSVSSLLFFPSTPNNDARPDILIDTTAVKDEWISLMSIHETQMQTRKYSDMLLTLSHLWGMSIGVEYAWGLYKNDPLVLTRLTDVTSIPKF